MIVVDQLDLRQLLRVDDVVAMEAEQLSGDRAGYRILSIDGNMVKVNTPEGFRLMPLYWLAQCANEGRLLRNGQML